MRTRLRFCGVEVESKRKVRKVPAPAVAGTENCGGTKGCSTGAKTGAGAGGGAFSKGAAKVCCVIRGAAKDASKTVVLSKGKCIVEKPVAAFYWQARNHQIYLS